MTLGENIADNGGVKTAFQAYKNVVKGKRPPSLPGVDLSADELFFVAFGQVCLVHVVLKITSLFSRHFASLSRDKIAFDWTNCLISYKNNKYSNLTVRLIISQEQSWPSGLILYDYIS